MILVKKNDSIEMFKQLRKGTMIVYKNCIVDNPERIVKTEYPCISINGEELECPSNEVRDSAHNELEENICKSVYNETTIIEVEEIRQQLKEMTV